MTSADGPAPEGASADAGTVRLGEIAASLNGYMSWQPDPGFGPGAADAAEEWAMLRSFLVDRLALTAADEAAWRHCWATHGGGTDPDASLLARLHDVSCAVADLRGLGRVPHGAPADRLTVRDALGWLCATSPAGNPSVYRVLPTYAHLPQGWLYFAAGIAPEEADGVDPTAALAMATLRGHVLPPVAP